MIGEQNLNEIGNEEDLIDAAGPENLILAPKPVSGGEERGRREMGRSMEGLSDQKPQRRRRADRSKVEHKEVEILQAIAPKISPPLIPSWQRELRQNCPPGQLFQERGEDLKYRQRGSSPLPRQMRSPFLT